MPSEFLDLLKEKEVSFSEHGLRELGDICKRVSVLYMTRIQRERFPEGVEGEQEYDQIKGVYCLKKEMLADVRHGFKVLHPLPKVFEIEPDVDEMDCAYYYEQAANGMHVRKALLQLIVGGGKRDG